MTALLIGGYVACLVVLVGSITVQSVKFYRQQRQAPHKE